MQQRVAKFAVLTRRVFFCYKTAQFVYLVSQMRTASKESLWRNDPKVSQSVNFALTWIFITSEANNLKQIQNYVKGSRNKYKVIKVDHSGELQEGKGASFDEEMRKGKIQNWDLMKLYLNSLNEMGNDTTKDNKEGQQEYERLGPVTIKESADPLSVEPTVFMQFDRMVENEKVLKSWTEQITRIEDSESKEILLLPEKHVFQKAGLCGSGGHVQLTYENFPYVLDSEIKNRKKLDRYFIETEMWYLLYNIIRAGNKFEKIGKKIGDVNPHNVVINDDGQIKVICTCSMPNQPDNFQRIVEDKNAKVYLAPEELNEDAINKGQYPPNVDSCKAEVFSIGLTILSSGILEDCFQVYNMGSRKINEGLLNQYLDRLREHYSPYLFATVVSMLNFDPSKRRKSSEIYNELYPHEFKILELEQFLAPFSQPQGSRYIQQSQTPSQVRASSNYQPGQQVHQLPQAPHAYINSPYGTGYPVSQSYQGPIRSTYSQNPINPAFKRP